MAKLATVTAHRNATVLDEASRSETLKVLLRRLGPILSHLRTARLGSKLDRENVFTLRIADQVDNGLIWRDLLLERDQIDLDTIGAKSGLDIGQAELVDDSAGICLETNAKYIQIFQVSGIDERGPSIFGRQLRNTGPVDDAALIALEGLVAWLVAELALHRVGWAATSRVALDAASIAGTGERTLDALVGTVGFVVTYLTAVVALPRHAIALRLARTVASEVPGLVATACRVSVLKLADGN